jgi:hypothetical protein
MHTASEVPALLLEWWMALTRGMCAVLGPESLPGDHGDTFELLQKLMQERPAPQDGHYEIGHAAEGPNGKVTAQAEMNGDSGDGDKQSAVCAVRRNYLKLRCGDHVRVTMRVGRAFG